MKKISRSESQTQAVAKTLARRLKPGDLVCLYGELGSGKTVFVRGLARALGCRGPVVSPTFTLIREYRGRKFHLYHLDLFRLSPRETEALEWQDAFMDPKGVCAVEWAEKLGPREFSRGCWKVFFKNLAESQRRIEWRFSR